MYKQIFYDLETTGLDTESDLPLQIAAVDSFGNTFERKITVPFEIPQEITNINGISNKDLIGATKLDDAISDFIGFIFKKPEGVKSYKGYQLWAHNGSKFDHLILHRLIKQINPDALNKYWWCVSYNDTILLAREKKPELKSFSLKNLCEHFNIPTLGHHNAVYDCQMLKQLHQKLCNS
jgi:DNA polymerase III epsilon subunit-like protein